MPLPENPPMGRQVIGDALHVMQGTVSEPQKVISHKYPNKPVEVSVRLVQVGSGLIGLETTEDSMEWSGLFNHILRTARVASYLGQELIKAGEPVDINLLKAAILSSHGGRRIWDESNWYRDVVPGHSTKIDKTDTDLTLDLLRKAGLPEELISTVEAHALGKPYPYEKMDTWEKKLALYADFRVSQSVTSLDERFDDLEVRAIPTGRFTQSWVDDTRKWAHGVEQDIFGKIPNLKPEDITNDNPPLSVWEGYLRRLYVQDAEAGIFKRISEFQDELESAISPEDEISIKLRMEAEFPANTWWGSYVRELYESQNGQPSKPKNKLSGVARAIEFYNKHKSES